MPLQKSLSGSSLEHDQAINWNSGEHSLSDSGCLRTIPEEAVKVIQPRRRPSGSLRTLRTASHLATREDAEIVGERLTSQSSKQRGTNPRRRELDC